MDVLGDGESKDGSSWGKLLQAESNILALGILNWDSA